ncbi:hypothetical protein Glove_350g39 [Diversispora epigaea]|uniref:TLDc domain-containing protein n=1 Tax=Diversispora epigaea TaxID=1348612 RepID=A0A397HCU7_9GLOM|nr:hypothetical protein Glove_350g39 [Diversispora epigaea]
MRVLTKTFPTRNITFHLSTQIITDEHALEILSWIDKKETPYIENILYEFGLLIKGNRDGFNIYAICDKVSKTIIVLKVDETGEIIGGNNSRKVIIMENETK